MKLNNRVIKDSANRIVARATSFNLAWIQVAQDLANASTDYLRSLKEGFEQEEVCASISAEHTELRFF